MRPNTVVKRNSDRIRAVRDTLPPNERDTLLDCPACDRAGTQMLTDDGRRYRTIVCTWCDGTLVVTPVLYAEWTAACKDRIG